MDYNMAKLQTHYAKWKKPDTKELLLYDYVYMIFPKKANIKTENRVIFAWGRSWSGSSQEQQNSWGDACVLKVECGEDCSSRSIYYKPLDNTLSVGGLCGM